ncbi:MAG: hypothetical protein Q9202_005282 [Teloschistes flavicans]
MPTPEANIQCLGGASCLSPTSTRTNIATTVQSPDLIGRTLITTVPSLINTQDVTAEFQREGWDINFVPYHFFQPIYTSSQALVDYMNQCMAIVAAHMLSHHNTSPPANLVFGSGFPLTLTIIGRARCMGCGGMHRNLTWELVYYLLLYLRNHAARGFSGTGALRLGQRQGEGGRQNSIVMSLRLREGLAIDLQATMARENRSQCGGFAEKAKKKKKKG